MKNSWWQETVAYQIYPRSFCDSNGDGVGDLNGITGKLDYLNTLGVDTIWLSPVYKSPMIDNGYDIADYYSVDPCFGTNEDMDRLLSEAKQKNIRVIMDLVVNHCSSEHEWFQEALENPEGKYGNYFYMKKGINGLPPNNWRSIFGGSAWEKIDGTDYYYLHLFAKEQPDLNWENEELREEIYKMMNHWLDKGVSGFRLDAITYLKKEEGLPSYPADADDGMVSVHYGALNKPGIEKFFYEMKERTYGRGINLTVGEVAGAVGEGIIPFVSLKNGYFSMIFDFSYIQLDMVPPNHFWCERKQWGPEDLKDKMFETHLAIQPEGWIANCLENHDAPRSVNYFLPPEGRNFYGESMLAMMSLGLRGTPFIYQGQEIGMDNYPFEDISMYDDCSSINQYKYALEQGYSEKEALEFVHHRSRDNSRYPFSWDDSEKAGFTTGQPWLPINPDHSTINAKKAVEDRNSLFYMYQKLIALRKNPTYKEVLVNGFVAPWNRETENLVAYERYLKQPGEKGNIFVICNYQNSKLVLELPSKNVKVLLDNYNLLNEEEGKTVLQPYQAIVVEV